MTNSPDNPRAIPGHNFPGPLAFAHDLADQLGQFVAYHPVIQTEKDSRTAGVNQRLAEECLKEIETLRVASVRPLNERVTAINAEHKSAGMALSKIALVIKARNEIYHRDQELERARIAEEARLVREAAERAAKDAEINEKEALDNAREGEIGVDILAAQQHADMAFSAFGRADRAAAIAAKDKFRTAVGVGRVIALRDKEILTVNDAVKALIAIGNNDNLNEAILTEARKYRREKGRLPDGVTSTINRVL
jgi:hypothetical protein